MATIKTSELSGAALDYAVAQCEGVNCTVSKTGFLIYSDKTIPTGPSGRVYEPSKVWSQAGPIIDRESISLERPIKMHGCLVVGFYDWRAVHPKNYGGLIRHSGVGPTPLVAAMRCYVASKMGDNVEIPDSLIVKE